MDATTLERYRQLIQDILIGHTQVPYAHGEIEFETVFDRQSDRYLLVLVGRDRHKRIHGCLIHVDLMNGKFWIQRDGTEYGVANELLDAGVPKEHIVLAFYAPAKRKYTDFAWA
jgi:hypothetical protein